MKGWARRGSVEGLRAGGSHPALENSTRRDAARDGPGPSNPAYLHVALHPAALTTIHAAPGNPLSWLT
jgi:hypothetical protein